MKQHNNKQYGFSLLELLVAFSILAIALTVLLNIFSSGVQTISVTEDYNQAVQIAESLMASTQLETPLKTAQHTGTTLDKYHWTVSIQPYTVITETNTTTNPATLFKIKIIVEWERRQIKLVNLKLIANSLQTK